MRFDQMVEEYDAEVARLASLPPVERLEAADAARKRLVHRIIEAYQNECSAGHEYYSNLIRSLVQEQIHAARGHDIGIRQAIEAHRVASNDAGDQFSDFTPTLIDKYMNVAMEIRAVRTLFSGMGVPDDADAVVATILARSFPDHNFRTQQVPVEFVAGPVGVQLRPEVRQPVVVPMKVKQ